MTTKISGDNISAIANTGVTWNAVTVADGSTQLNASAGNGYFLDTNAGTIDVNLPTSPTRGDTIVIADYGNNFATNRVIINTGGKLIDSVVGGDPGTSGFKIETNGAVVELIFADDTAGWIIKQNNVPSDLEIDKYQKYVTATGGTVTTSGDYKIHTFTGDGCFVVSCAGNPDGSNTVDYLVVAGGGAGGDAGNRAAGGGGGGGYRESHSTPVSGCYTASPLATPTGITVTTTTYPITVGAGGAGTSCNSTNAGSGANSVFSTITASGGGGGGNCCVSAPSGRNGIPGGSGGGGGASGFTGCGGTGNTPPTSPPQGNNGGNSSPGTGSCASGGGGGGGIAAGTAGITSGGAGPGGAGAGTLINPATGESGPGCLQYYAGGGGGAAGCAGGPNGQGGIGGGGNGEAFPDPPQVTSGDTNTGGGGGGAASNQGGGNGGKGIVIIRYKFQN